MTNRYRTYSLQLYVIPAQAGIQASTLESRTLDSRLRGNDKTA